MRGTDGFNLLECVVYLAVFALILGLATACYFRVDENNRHLSRNAGDILRTLRAGEQWRADIRLASGAIQVAAAGQAEELAIPHPAGVVKYIFREGSVWRQTGTRPVEVLPNVVRSNMQRDSRQFVTAWRWEVELKGKARTTRVKPMFAFEAVTREGKP